MKEARKLTERTTLGAFAAAGSSEKKISSVFHCVEVPVIPEIDRTHNPELPEQL